MPTLLFVDDDLNFLLSLGEGLRAIHGEYQIHTAKNGKLAVKILKTKPVDLVVTDLRMPIMDGFELIAYMSRHNSQIPIIVITAHGTPEIESNIRASAAFQYLEKPLDFDILVERVNIGLLARSSGQSKGISLHSFLQLVELEKKNFTLSIRSERMLGFLRIKNGKLIDAETAHNAGENAALEIMGWDVAEIEIDQKDASREPKIFASLNSLIQQSIRGEAVLAQESAADPDKEIDHTSCIVKKQ